MDYLLPNVKILIISYRESEYNYKLNDFVNLPNSLEKLYILKNKCYPYKHIDYVNLPNSLNKITIKTDSYYRNDYKFVSCVIKKYDSIDALILSYTNQTMSIK